MYALQISQHNKRIQNPASKYIRKAIAGDPRVHSCLIKNEFHLHISCEFMLEF